MAPMREMAFEQHLLKIPQRRRHRLRVLAERQEMRLDHLLTKAGTEQPRPEVPHVPPIEGDRLDVQLRKEPAEMTHCHGSSRSGRLTNWPSGTKIIL
jgi:hypothetical protein